MRSRRIAANVGISSCRSLARPGLPSARERGRRWPLDATRTELPLAMRGAPVEQDVIVRGSYVFELARALRAVEPQWLDGHPARGLSLLRPCGCSRAWHSFSPSHAAEHPESADGSASRRSMVN